MDAIRKKMQSLKSETDGLNATIQRFENETKDANKLVDQHECDIRDLGKKIQTYEVDFDETNDKLTKTLTQLEEKLKLFKTAEEEVSALSRRILLMEEEAKKSRQNISRHRNPFSHDIKRSRRNLEKGKIL